MGFASAGIGLVILLFSGDALVRGAVNMSLRLGVPALLVSLTIVAIGTSAPELLISIGAILDGVPGIALGNVVGSNIANVLLVLGVPAIVSRLPTNPHDTRRNYVVMLAGTALFVALAFLGPFTWWHGLVLLAALTWIFRSQFVEARSHRRAGREHRETMEVEGADPSLRWWKIIAFLVIGLAGLPLGADLLIDGAKQIAQRFGVSDTVIGLTLVAIGTSLPELATTVMAAIRSQAEVAIGNVIGSNILNLLGIIGVAALVGPIPVDPAVLRFDLWVMVAASLLLAPFVFLSSLDLTRRWGVLLTMTYVVYIYRVVA